MPKLLYGSDDIVAEFVKKALQPDIDEFGLFSAIGITDEGGKLIAGVVYNQFFGRDIQATIASTSKRWASRNIMRAIFAYPFFQLGCYRITAQTRSRNLRSISFLYKSGFQKEGLLRGWYEDDDALIMGMMRIECRWINKSKEENNG